MPTPTAVAAGARWATEAAKKAGVPEQIVEEVADEAAKRIGEVGKGDEAGTVDVASGPTAPPSPRAA